MESCTLILRSFGIPSNLVARCPDNSNGKNGHFGRRNSKLSGIILKRMVFRQGATSSLVYSASVRNCLLNVKSVTQIIAANLPVLNILVSMTFKRIKIMFRLQL